MWVHAISNWRTRIEIIVVVVGKRSDEIVRWLCRGTSMSANHKWLGDWMILIGARYVQKITLIQFHLICKVNLLFFFFFILAVVNICNCKLLRWRGLNNWMGPIFFCTFPIFNQDFLVSTAHYGWHSFRWSPLKSSHLSYHLTLTSAYIIYIYNTILCERNNSFTIA